LRSTKKRLHNTSDAQIAVALAKKECPEISQMTVSHLFCSSLVSEGLSKRFMAEEDSQTDVEMFAKTTKVRISSSFIL
jgi:hypothetical protein